MRKSLVILTLILSGAMFFPACSKKEEQQETKNVERYNPAEYIPKAEPKKSLEGVQFWGKPETKPECYHPVQKGDTLGEIATRYNTSVEALMKIKYNQENIPNKNKIYPPQKIQIRSCE